MGLSSIISRVVPAVVGYATGGPIGATRAVVATEAQKSAEARAKRNFNREQDRIKTEEQRMSEIFGSGNITSVQAPMAGRTTANAGFGAGFGSFLQDVGRNIVSPIASIYSGIRGFSRTPSTIQQPALTTIGAGGAQESQGSGSIQAGMGGLAGQAFGVASRFLRSPGGSLATGVGAGALTSLLGPDGRPMRITRKMRSQLRSLLNQTNNNYALVGDFLGLDENQMLEILSKRFRNDGPVVTKAALRKTKQTVRRLKSMCDMYDSLRPTATRRRSPMKRTSTTLIKN